MNITENDVIRFLDSADRETRSRINRHICGLFDADNAKARAEFKYGDKVKFCPRKLGYPPVVTGTVVQRNPKTIEVRPDGGGRNWRVSPAMLTKA